MMREKTTKSIAEGRDIERAERLREVLAALAEVNSRFPVVVEGKNDALALRQLGLEGEMLVLHRGQRLYDFCEEVAERFPRIVLLLDWDLKGEHLQRSLAQNLSGHWEEFSPFRDILKVLCQKEIKDIEGIPKLLQRLEGNEPSR